MANNPEQTLLTELEADAPRTSAKRRPKAEDPALQLPVPTVPAVKDFFDQLAKNKQYDEKIFQACPVYQQAMDVLVDSLHIARPDRTIHILDLGCGTGLLTMLMAKTFPRAIITAVDMSTDMLEATERNMADYPNRVHYRLADINNLTLTPESFDIVVAGFSLHHLEDHQKSAFIRKMIYWLAPGGQFRCVDETLTLPARQHDHYVKRWQQMAKEAGATDEDIAVWLDHAVRYDRFASLSDHLQWLELAGFEAVDCYWKQLYWCVFGAQRPQL